MKNARQMEMGVDQEKRYSLVFSRLPLSHLVVGSELAAADGMDAEMETGKWKRTQEAKGSYGPEVHGVMGRAHFKPIMFLAHV
jgi:hypothetical protein